MDADRSRFEAVLAEFGSQIDRMLVAYERRDDLRDELRQEVALAVWRALPSFRGDSSLRNLIARVTHNVGVSHVRKAVRGTPTELLDPELPIAAPDPQPEDLLLEADRIRRLPFDLFRSVNARSLCFSWRISTTRRSHPLWVSRRALWRCG